MVTISLFEAIQAKETELGRQLTSKAISDATGVHETTISQYKNGRVKMVKLETLGKLASYFGCEPGDLIKRKSGDM